MDIIDDFQGFVHHDEVSDAVSRRLNALNGNKDELYATLTDAVTALMEINEAVPADSQSRYLVASALERFANGSTEKAAHQEPAAA